MPRRNHARLVLAAAASVSGFAMAQPAQAVIQYWDNNGAAAGFGATSGTWDTVATNWNDVTGVGAPTTWTNGNDALFQGTGGTIQFVGNISAGAITLGPSTTFSNSANTNATLAFNSLTLPPTSVATNITGGLVGDANGDVNIISNNAATISNGIGVGSINNTYTGDVNLLGTIPSGTPSASSRIAFLINNLGAVPTTATFNMARNFSQVVFNVQAVGGPHDHGNIPNNFVLNSNNDVSNYEGWIGALGGVADNFNTVDLTGTVSGAGTLTFGLNTAGGGGIITLSNNSTYTGNTRFMTAAAGIVRLDVDDALPATPTTTTGLIWGAGGSNAIGALDLNAKDQTITSILTSTSGTQAGIVNNGPAIDGTSILTIKGNVTASYSGPLGVLTAVNANLTNTGNHSNIKVVLHADNTGIQTFARAGGMAYSGGTEINGGMLSVTNTSGSGTGSGPITIGPAGTLRIGATTASGAVDTVNPVTNNGLLIVNRIDAVAQSAIVGVINGIGSFTKAGNGTLTLDTANGYTGTTTVNAGTLTVSDASGLGGTTGALAVNNPTIGAGTNVVLNLPTTAATTKGSLSGAIANPSSGTNTATINNGGQLLTINQTADATFAGVIAGTGGFTLGSLSTNTLTLTGANTYTGPTTASAGKLVLGASLTTSSALNATGGNVEVAAGGDKIVKTGAVSISPGNTIDLKDNDMIVQNTTASAVRSLITGNLLVTTGTPPAGKTAGLGYAQGDDAGIAGLGGSLAGQSFLAADVAIKYTYFGDADLDGDVDGNDVGAWAGNFTGSGGSSNKVWTQGDWDYDGDVDGNDVGLWAGNFTGSGGGVLSLPNAQPGAVAALEAMGFTVVPEPASLGLLGVAGIGLLGRRRRRGN